MAVVLLLLWSLRTDCSGDQCAPITTRIFRFNAHASWQPSAQLTAGSHCPCSCKDTSVSSRIQVYERTLETPSNVGKELLWIKNKKRRFWQGEHTVNFANLLNECLREWITSHEAVCIYRTFIFFWNVSEGLLIHGKSEQLVDCTAFSRIIV